jgi:hypothetical protein
MALIDYRTRLLEDYIVMDRRLAERPGLTIVCDDSKPLRYAIVRASSQQESPSKRHQGMERKLERLRRQAEDDDLMVLMFLLNLAAAKDLGFLGPFLDEITALMSLYHAPKLVDELAASLFRCDVSKQSTEWKRPSRPESSWHLIYQWCRAFGFVCPPKTALVRVVDFSPELLRFLQEDPARLRSLTPDEFERFVANRMDRMGYNVTLTGAANRKDGGIDLIAVPRLANVGSHVIAGQMKHHRGDQTTGRDAVDRLLAWKDSYFGVGLLVTNTAFTRDAVWTAQQERNARFLRLRDFTDLKRWLQDQYGSEEDWREIPDRIELAPGVVIEIPRPRIVVPSES